MHLVHYSAGLFCQYKNYAFVQITSEFISVRRCTCAISIPCRILSCTGLSMGFTPMLKVFRALHICIANCAGHKKCPYSECVCVLPAKQDSIICTYLALGCIAHKRKHNQTIVCQVRNESVALALCA